MTMKLRILSLALALLGACGLTHERAADEGPQARPSATEGFTVYTVGRLSFEAPASWRATGSARQVLLVSPADDARIDVQQVEGAPQASDEACLARAQEALTRGAARLENVRRHATTLAGRRAVVQEADQQGWHGWAWAVCDRGEQYRLFFTGRSPVPADGVRAVRRLSSSAVLAGAPGA